MSGPVEKRRGRAKAPEPQLPKRRGRPPRLSREQILDAGLSLVRSKGRGGLTARALASKLGTSRMALYGHFESVEELLADVAAHAVEKMALEVPRRGSWRTILDGWLRGIRREFRVHPELLPLLAGEDIFSRTLLTGMARCAGALEEAGLPRPAAVRAVQGSLWAAIGFVVCETAEPVRPSRVIALLGEEDRKRVEPFADHLAFDDTDALFGGVLTRTLDGLATEIERADRPRRRRARQGT
jgi:AcrR family transcriptional regulator